MDDLQTYQQKNSPNSVLLFPSLPSRLRYLIHKTIEDLPELTTFSVGDTWCRRVVVCHSELRGELQEDSDVESNTSLSEEPLSSREEREGDAKPKSSVSKRCRGPKRPEKALYMPRAARERLHPKNSHVPSGDEDLPSPASSCCSCIDSLSDSGSCSETSLKPSSVAKEESHPGDVEGILNIDADGSMFCPLEEKHNSVLRPHETEPLVWEHTISCFSGMSLGEDVKEEDLSREPCSAMTEDSSTDADDLNEEIKAHLKATVAVSIEHVHNDYSVYENVCMNPDEFRHVIEIYGFPSMFKTDDLLDAFIDYSDGGMKINWVDDTHALGVFSSDSAALHALSICHPLLKARTLAEGSKKSRGKAFRQAEFIQPVRERPRTDCAVARRMVTRALGLQGRGRVQRY